MKRDIQDASKTATLNIPAAGASATTAALDIEQPTAQVINEMFDVVVVGPPALAGKATATLEDSKDGQTFAAIAQLAPASLVATSDALAAEARFKLPGSARQYIRATLAVGSGAGDLTAQTFALQFRF